jgi:transcriptional regulator with XRE-family HTH domain
MRLSTNQPLMNALATEMKLRRRELGFSQEDLAGACQIDRPYISLIEVGRKQPTLSVLLRLADGLQFSLAELMDRVQKRYAMEAK